MWEGAPSRDCFAVSSSMWEEALSREQLGEIVAARRRLPLSVARRTAPRAASPLGDRRAARRTSGMVAARRRHPRSFVLDPHMIPALFVLRSYRFRAIYRGIPGRRLPPPPKGTRKGRPDKMLQRDIMVRPSLLNRGPTNSIILYLRILGGNLGSCSHSPGERSRMDL